MKRLVISRIGIFPVLVLSSVFMMFNSCEKDTETVLMDASLKKTSSIKYTVSYDEPDAFPCGDFAQVKMIAGQTKDAGFITVMNNEEKVYILLETNNGYYFSDVHLYAGSLSKAPINNGGQPVLGHFPIIISNLPQNTSFLSIELNAADFDPSFIVAAKLEVYKIVNNKVTDKDAAWPEGKRFNQKGNWATYTEYEKQECVFEYIEDCVIKNENYPIYISRNGTLAEAGVFTLTNDNKHLTLTVRTIGRFAMKKLNFYAGRLNKLPVGQDNYPVVENFPYIESSEKMIFTYTFKIPLKKLPVNFVVSACIEFYQAVDRNGTYSSTSEIGWADHIFVQRNTYWSYTEYCRQCIK